MISPRTFAPLDTGRWVPCWRCNGLGRRGCGCRGGEVWETDDDAATMILREKAGGTDMVKSLFHAAIADDVMRPLMIAKFLDAVAADDGEILQWEYHAFGDHWKELLNEAAKRGLRIVEDDGYWVIEKEGKS